MRKRSLYFICCCLFCACFFNDLNATEDNVIEWCVTEINLKPNQEFETIHFSFFAAPPPTEDNVMDWFILKKLLGPNLVNVGDTVKYAISVINNDTIPIDSVIVNEIIPEGTSLIDTSWIVYAPNKVRKMFQNGGMSGSFLLPQDTAIQVISLVIDSAALAFTLPRINMVEIYNGTVYGEEGEPIKVKNLNEENNIAEAEPVYIRKNNKDSKNSKKEKPNLNSAFQCLNIYPNPVINKIQIDLECTKETEIVLKVIDMNGYETIVENRIFNAGLNVVTLDLGNIPAGFYYIHLSGEGHFFIEELVKH